MADYASLHSRDTARTAGQRFLEDWAPELAGAAFGTAANLTAPTLFRFALKYLPVYRRGKGDYYMLQSLTLLEDHASKLSIRELKDIQEKWKSAEEIQELVQGKNALAVLLAWGRCCEYKRHAKDTYIITHKLSSKARVKKVFEPVTQTGKNAEASSSAVTADQSSGGSSPGGDNRGQPSSHDESTTQGRSAGKKTNSEPSSHSDQEDLPGDNASDQAQESIPLHPLTTFVHDDHVSVFSWTSPDQQATGVIVDHGDGTGEITISEEDIADANASSPLPIEVKPDESFSEFLQRAIEAENSTAAGSSATQGDIWSAETASDRMSIEYLFHGMTFH